MQHQQQECRHQPLRDAIKHMVANISKSFIVDWYLSISPTNHDFVASCENLIEEALIKLAELCISKLDKYKTGQIICSLLHNHILNENSTEKITSIENQIINFEYDICQNSVVRLFGLLSNDTLRRVVFTTIDTAIKPSLNDLHSQRYHTAFSKLYGSSIPSDRDPSSLESNDEYSKLQGRDHESTRTTSALYTLVIAMLTKAAFMPIIDNISEPRWLYAVIIWSCKKRIQELASREDNIRREAAADESSNQQYNLSKKANNHFRHDIEQMPPPPPPSSSPNKVPGASITLTKPHGDCRTLDLEDGIALANINFENPICGSLKRPLDNVEIYATEEVKSNNSCYILYCIRYEGLCYRHPSAGGFSFIPEQPYDAHIIDRRQQARTSASTGSRRPLGMNPRDEIDNPGRRSFRRMMTIKRRFREFVLLQLRLEENPKIRPYLKNIPKPTKLKAATQNIFSLPGITNIKLDQTTIKLRQRFLERFLNALNSSPFIANSYEFKEFFSYNINSATGMSKSKSTILQVNLNKVFVDSVRNAFSLIRSTLPGDDMQSLSTPNGSDPDAWLTELQQSTLKLHIQTRTSHSKMNLERLIDSKLLSLNDSPVRSNKSSSLGRYYQRKGAFECISSSRGGSLRSTMIKTSSLSSEDTNSPIILSRSSSSTSTSQNVATTNNVTVSKSNSIESIYHDASDFFESDQNGASGKEESNACKTIQICDSIPIATKIIDIVHYSISGNNECSQSPINYMAQIFMGRFIEKYALQLLESAFTVDNAAFCIDSITRSIWDESDDPPLDLENASLDEAVASLVNLIELSFARPKYMPKQLLLTLLNKQLKFYLSQIASKRRNKFVIYSFFVHLLDELELQGSSST